MNSIHPLLKRDKDKDLERILHLYEIIKRYELLVEHLLTEGKQINFDDFDMKEYLDKIERNILTQAFEYAHGNMCEIERITGRSRTNLAKKLTDYGIKQPKLRLVNE